MNDITITCANEGCTNQFEWPTLPGCEILENLICDPCEKIRDQIKIAADEADKSSRIEQLRASSMIAIDAATPSRYRHTDISHPTFNRDLWEQVKEWKPTRLKPWIGIVGRESGSCKTRIALLLLRKIIAESNGYFGFEIITSHDFKKLALAQYVRSKDEEESPRDILDRLATCDNLLLDDIGKAKHTPAVAEELFTIIDHRYANILPINWTSNCHPCEFAADIADKELAGPMVGRIMECSLIIDLDS